MRPTQSDVHVSRPLSNLLIAYFQDEKNFIASRVFPEIPVQFKTDQYYKWTRDDFHRVEVAERAPATPSEGGSFVHTTDTYTCKEYAIHKDIPDAVAANADSELHLDEAASRYIGHQLLLKRESVWTSTYFTTSVWTGSSTGSDLTGVAGTPTTGQFKQWDQTSSDPIGDITAQMVSMAEATGKRPNKLVLGPRTWQKLQNHPDIIDRIKYTMKGVVSLELLASLLGLDEVLVPYSTRNTAAMGATASFSFFAGKAALLLYASGMPSIMEPSAGITFAWAGRFGAGASGGRVKRFRLEEIESWRIEGQMAFAQKVVCSDLGCYFTAAVA